MNSQATTTATIAQGDKPLLQPLLLWLVIQFAALSLPAAQVKLWANFPAPAERMALMEMLFVQIFAAALLFPYLLRGQTLAGIIVMASWPFTVLAAYLSAEQQDWLIVTLAALVTSWLLCLAICNRILVSVAHQLLGVALASCLVLGAPLLWYLHLEFNAGKAHVNWNQMGCAGPFFAALAFINEGIDTWAAWYFVAGSLSLTLLAWLVVTFVRKGQKVQN